MQLEDVIKTLEKYPPEQIVVHGWDRAHSDRGNYSDLAFGPADDVNVGQMLQVARGALGSVFEGYKGGSYKMAEYTECYLAHWGYWTGIPISYALLGWMLEDPSLAEQDWRLACER